jgi:cyclopropane-fatty-acyl-phospholipid synthase
MCDSTSIFVQLTTALSGLYNALFGQSLHNSKLNVIASYDQSNELFKVRPGLMRLVRSVLIIPCEAFLDDRMMYSCALWSDGEGGPSGDISLRAGNHSKDLEAAQLRKIHHVLRKARAQPGHRLLEFGSGWGALAIEVGVLSRALKSWKTLTCDQAARSYGCEVDTLTLSYEQKKLAEERIHAAGLQDQIRVHLMDYRELPPDFEKAFDAFVSVEMIEVCLIAERDSQC